MVAHRRYCERPPRIDLVVSRPPPLAAGPLFANNHSNTVETKPDNHREDRMAKTESKSYKPAETEKRIFDFWQNGGFFHPEPDDRPRDRRFCMVIPPPNVTGALHLGHALNNTLQDILIRQKRMAGYNTFWLLGTDHAGIATQATVEKTIRKTEGKSRHDLGRKDLVRRIWEWKEKHGGRIVEQLKLMGCSCDYQRERFTLDEGCAKAVRHTFFKLFADGLIYRGKRLVNWDTLLQTAVADDEVYHETVKGHFYHFKYPVNDPAPGEPEFVYLATTRPETMLADTAVAVHPEPDAALDRVEAELKQKLVDAPEKEKPGIRASLEDIVERRQTVLPTLIKLRDMARAGRMVTLPLVNREIPLICDEWAKPELGSGCVKITPAHDPNDYDVGQRHDLPRVNVMTEDGKIARIVEPDGSVNPNSEKYEGLRFATKGREKVVADLEALGLVEKIEDRMIDLGHSDRSKAPIEPFLSDQWFVKMGDLTEEEAARVQSPFLREYIDRCGEEPRPSGRAADRERATPDSLGKLPGLAQMAIDAVTSGAVKFHPPRYEKTYIDWLSEKRDWCISRQLWWGHRIPVWSYRPFIDATFDTVDEAMEHGAVRDKLLERVENWADENRVVHRFAEGSEETTPKLSLRRAIANQFVCVRAENDREVVKALEHIGFKQDPDVLDTWFSSALWPHSTLGWPDAMESADTAGKRTTAQAEAYGSSSRAAVKPRASSHAPDKPRASARAVDRTSDAPLLDYFYPTSVLSTAREIITLWVARMVMTGLYNTGKIPFSDVVIHPVIQDGQGRKMSKSLGNGVDPVDIIDEYGADALRFTLAELATETQDIRMPAQPKKLPDGRTINVSPKFEKGRNFCNKLWQAATGFVIRNLDGYDPKPLDPARLGLEDRWILSRLTACTEEVDRALSKYRCADAVGAAYRFMWNEYCDWYIEMAKPRLVGDDRATTQQVLVFVLDQLLRILHPIVPFVTEALWSELSGSAPRRGLRDIAQVEPTLITAAWPRGDATLRDEAVETEMALLQDAIRAIREIRTSVNGARSRQKLPAIRTLPSVVIRADDNVADLLTTHRGFLALLADCDRLDVRKDQSKPSGAISSVLDRMQVFVPVGDLVDLAQFVESQQAALDELRAAKARADKQLANENFVRRADPEVVEQARQRAADLTERIRSLEEHLSELRRDSA